MTSKNQIHSSKNENDMILLIGNCYTIPKTSGVLEVYSRSRNEWRIYKDYQLDVRNFAVAKIDDRLMLIGGANTKNEAVNTVLSIDLKTGTLTTETSLNEAKYNIGVAVIGTGSSAKLYAIGGAGEGVYKNSVERWDPITRKWTLMAPMSIKRHSCAVTVFNDKIYVIGGSGTQQYKSMDMYDPKTDVWTHIGNNSTIGGYCSATATEEYIYLFGGYPGEWRENMDGTVERYHPYTDTWCIVGSLTPVGVRSLLTVEDKIITTRGHLYDRDVEEFDITTYQQKTLATTIYGREMGTFIMATLEDAVKK